MEKIARPLQLLRCTSSEFHAPMCPRWQAIHHQWLHQPGQNARQALILHFWRGNVLIEDNADGSVEKYYVVLFTCAVTRAVHLEVVGDLTAQTFLNSFRRFIARRGLPKLVLSDNATNFWWSSKILNEYMGDELVWSFMHHNSRSW